VCVFLVFITIFSYTVTTNLFGEENPDSYKLPMKTGKNLETLKLVLCNGYDFRSDVSDLNYLATHIKYNNITWLISFGTMIIIIVVFTMFLLHSTQRKPPNFQMSPTNFDIILYQVLLTIDRNQTPNFDTDYICRCKSNYHTV